MSKDDITWPQLSRWWPIIAGCVAITLSYATLIAQNMVLTEKIANTNYKIDDVVTLIKIHQDEEGKFITNLNDLNKRIVVLETEHKALSNK